MYKKIVEELKTFSEPDFAVWVKPFLSIDEKSKEIVIGVRVPILRSLAKKYNAIDLKTLRCLLRDNIHEVRALAVFIMLIKSKKTPIEMRDLYLENLDMINNWDLIDYSAPHIVAPYVKPEILRNLADSPYLWANRVAMVSTIYYIKKDDFVLALEFAEKFMKHEHHLMHKAAGWMLREVGKRDVLTLKSFLENFSGDMPSIMRSYASERLKKYGL